MAWDSTVDSKTSGTPLPADKGQFGQNNATEEHKPLPKPPATGDSGAEQPVNQGPQHQEYGGERS